MRSTRPKQNALKQRLTHEHFPQTQMCAGSHLHPGTYADADGCFVACSIDQPPGRYFSFESHGHCFFYTGSGPCELTEAVPIRARALQTEPPLVVTYRVIVPVPRATTTVRLF